MLKESPEGQTHYCEACEEQARSNTVSTKLHTCGADSGKEKKWCGFCCPITTPGIRCTCFCHSPQPSVAECEHGVAKEYCFNCRFIVKNGLKIEMFDGHHYVRLKHAEKAIVLAKEQGRTERTKEVAEIIKWRLTTYGVAKLNTDMLMKELEK